MDGEQVTVNLEYLEDRFAEGVPTPRQSRPSIPASAGATWRDVSIVVFDNFLRVMVCGKAHEVEFAEIGMDQQSQPLELLRLFAAARGTLDATKLPSVVSGDSPIKMRILRLRQLLQTVIDVDGDPLGYAKKARAYTCKFQIRLDRDEGFRAPSGASWLDFAFHERADGRVLVSLAERRTFRSHGLRAEDGRKTTEVAEQSATITRTHSLEEIGLRADTGKLTEEGAAFIAMLRAGGTLPRRANDMVVLKLAKRLREWTGLEGEPLRLVEASGTWTAVFACASDVRPERK